MVRQGFHKFRRLEYGIPSLLIAQNNLHKSLLREWQKSGCAISSSIINKNKFINNLKNLLESKKQINKMKKNIKIIFDGKGLTRLEKLINLLTLLKNNLLS